MAIAAPSKRSARRFGIPLGIAVIAVIAGVGWALPQAGAADPTLTMTPGPTSHPYANGQNIALSVGPNSTFTPNFRIEVLECAAPKGVLPVDDSTCDGNTAQYGSVLVAANGSLQVPAYTLYQLPNATLGEQNNHAPVCNASEECVLYLGQDQNDFTRPKIFSPPFTVGSTAPAGTTPTAAGGTAPAGGSASHSGASGSTPTAGSAGGVDPSASLGTAGGTNALDPAVSAQAPGTLAFTGVEQLPLLVGAGLLLMVLGTVGIHTRRRAKP